jgi:alkylhydroperoxidase/carboxymuconolactone decarboxylase family protein YurZ
VEAQQFIDQLKQTGRLNQLWQQLADWDPEWTAMFMRMGLSAWTSGVLPSKTVEFICIAGDASCTHMYGPGVRRHIRAALDLGATREEILEVLKLASVVGIHACNLGVPILAEELSARGENIGPVGEPHPAIGALRASGRWNPLWDKLADWDPEWTALFIQMGSSAWRSGILDPKTVEFICIAGDASATHMYAPGVRRHIRAALDLGATRKEILEVLKLASVIGIHACNLGVPILAEELQAR